MNAAAPAGDVARLRDRALLFAALFWLLNAGYSGIVHDAALYTFQALAHREPDLLSGDLFLRFGSQDRFTLFTPLYSALIGALGLEPAAMIATLTSLLALLLAGTWLLRVVVPERVALLGVAFVLALPSDFGPHGVLHYVETFITPRMAAQALTLAALGCALTRRPALAAGSLLGAACMHPLMAAPGVAMVTWIWCAPARTRWLVLCAAGGLIGLALLGLTPLLGAMRVDPAWREAIDLHADYVFVSTWYAHDWSRALTAIATLLVGARVLSAPPARTLCLAAVFAAASGVAIAAIGGDWLGLSLVLQGQGFRWLWPASLIAVLLLPAIGAALWRAGTHGRTLLCLLASLWLLRSETLGLVLAPVVVAAAMSDRWRPTAESAQRWLLRGCVALLALLAISALADSLLAFSGAFEDTASSEVVDRIRTFCRDGLVSVAFIVALDKFADRGRHARLAVCGLVVALGALLVAPHLATWRRAGYSNALFAQFAAWRASIPERSEVLWVEAPASAWFLLNRPSFFSREQTGSVLFSRAAALELVKREKALVPYMLYAGLAAPSDATARITGSRDVVPQDLAMLCATGPAYVVSRANLRAVPLAVSPPGTPSGYRAARLYRCDPSSTPQAAITP